MNSRKPVDRLITIVFLADFFAAILPATVAFLLKDIDVTGYVLFVVVTLGLTFIVVALLRTGKEEEEERQGI